MIQHAKKKSTRQSLSARRAWIEITGRSVEFHLYASLSARRAWIEIMGLDGRFKL